MIPTTYTYTQLPDEFTNGIIASTGIKPMKVTLGTAATVAVLTPDVLSATDKADLDQFFADRGYTFTGQVP